MSHGIEMLLVVLALVLFSTILLGVYNSLSSQSALIGRDMYLTQTSKYANRYSQKIEAENVSPDFSFDYIYNTYQNYTDSISIDGVLYHANITSSYCDSLGNTANPKDEYQKIDIRAWCKPAGYDTIWVGTASNPISIIIVDMGK